MSAHDLAAAAGVSASTVTQIEPGEINPTVAMLEQLLETSGNELELSITPRGVAPTLDAVRQHRDAIETVASSFGASNVRVFGSVARGHATVGSDVDLQIDVRGPLGSQHNGVDDLAHQVEAGGTDGDAASIVGGLRSSHHPVERRGGSRRSGPQPASASGKTAGVHHLRRWGHLVVLMWLTWLAIAVGGDSVAAQSTDNGLEESSVNSFEFDPGKGVVRVTIDITLRNVTTDQVDGNVVNRTYFDGYFAAVPRGAENVVATRNGSVLAGELISDPEFPAFSTYRFPLDTQLFSGRSTTVQVTYDHLGAPPRDPVPWRVNEAYAGFVALGLGDEGLVTLRISQPFGYEFDEFTDLTGFDVGEPDGFGTVLHTRSGLNDETRITVGMANNDRLVSGPLDVDGVDIKLRSWPDDPEWADFAAGRVETGIPALEELIGSDWPVEGSFAVRQTVEPNLRGYAGWFDAQSNEIAVGEALDADTIYHELSHAWFNGRMSTERWLTEGIAQVYAAELVRSDGDGPRAPVEPSADDPAAAPLTDWGGVGSERAVEEYGYATSFWVLAELVDAIGFDRTDEVVAALRSGVSPYDAGVPGERSEQDWKRVYDTFVEVGGASSVGELFRDYIVGADDAALIDQRDRAAVDVAGLADRSVPWALPVGVRNSLELWEIDDVADGVVGADAVLERRSVLESIEQSVGVDEPDRASAAYAQAPRRSTIGVDFAEPTAILDDSIEIGGELEQRVGDIDDLATTAGVTPPVLGTVDGVEGFATGLAVADDQFAALERIVEVDEQLDVATGLMATIGRWGSDIEHDLDQARAQVERGDNDAALATLESAENQIDGLAASGALRLAIAGSLAVLLVGLLGLLALIRRRRNREVAADAANRA